MCAGRQHCLAKRWVVVAAGQLAMVCVATAGYAQSARGPVDDAGFFEPFTWRSIGPRRGGRSIAVAGSASRSLEYYFGATGGGLWKTTDGGVTWGPVTDGQIGSSSVGAVAVAASDPDVVYIGMGETELRGNVMQGDGVYKSTDGGNTWIHMGLTETQAIARIRVHPADPNVVYVAALGHPYGANPERGVFRSVNGGQSWERILYRSDRAGAVDLFLDPNDPAVVYATLWEVYRRPWILWSGGAGSGLFKSSDGGDSWVELTHRPGLPSGPRGKITVTVSGADSRRVYANIEAADGGLYRSDDGGETWIEVNDHRDLWQRSFYFMRILADPVDRETVYVMNFMLHRSTDGGVTFEVIDTPHADHHDLWIDPTDPSRMINANDGGANVSVNGGRTWTVQRYPTAQIYRLETTADHPYHVCGAQQDNTTVCVPSRRTSGAVSEWYSVGGGENAYIASNRDHPDVFYAGATNTLTRFDRVTGQSRDIQPEPFMVMGEPAADMPERWNWVYPVVLSPIDPKVLYVGSQHLWKTIDEGKSWEKISPDLTRADPSTMRDSGGPIIKDQDGPEIYATIFTIAPSRHDTSTIWVGSDDGLVEVTRDGGETWHDITPPGVPKDTRISFIEASPHRRGGAYVAGKRYEMDDRAAYLWKTDDYGASWTRIVDGIPPGHFVHTVREDPRQAGLLYAGTEHGVYVSFDDGTRWRSLSLNLPDVHVSGIAVEERDLVIATHGRSFYVLEDIEPLRQWSEVSADGAFHLFTPAAAERRLYPAAVDYYLRNPAGEVAVEILDAARRSVRRLDGASTTPGLHRLTWDLRYPGATVFAGIVLEGGDPRRGPWAPPGEYRIRLTVDGRSQLRNFRVRMDPRLTDVSEQDLRAQFELALRVRDRTSEANEAVIRIRDIVRQVGARLAAVDDEAVRGAGERVIVELSAVEGALYQVKNQSPKDKIAYPIKLNNRLSGLLWNLQRGDGPPTEGHYRVFEALSAELDVLLEKLDDVVRGDFSQLNELLVGRNLEPVNLRR